MVNELENPFSVTKATEFNDCQINEYWVDFNATEDKSIEALLNPTEFLPKYVIGGKGCGKTHILRYFSFPLQKIRHGDDINEVLNVDKYIGIYSVFHGINSSRFQGKGIPDEQWHSVFEYYFELYIADSLLQTIDEIFESLKIEKLEEEKLLKGITSIFRLGLKESINTIKELIEFLVKLRRSIDTQILNAAFTRTLNYRDVEVLFSPGDLIFGIPNCISSIIECFNGIKFIYILDEYEKFFDWQKVFVNTLVWDKKNPVTFWIGARRYGYTNRETKTGEQMKNGSEFQEIILDEIMRAQKVVYKSFAEKLFTNRLAKYYESIGIYNDNADDLKFKFNAKLETYNEDMLIQELKKKYKKKEYKHLVDLREKLVSGVKDRLALELNNEVQIDKIIKQVIKNTDSDPLLQKYKIFYLYKAWFQAKDGMTMAEIVRQMNLQFSLFKSNKPNEFDEIKDKRKKDFIVQLCRENHIKNYTEYLGLDKFIDLSEGNPRTFLLLLKKIIEYSKVRGEKPLEDGGVISLDSQILSVYETAKWFYEDAKPLGDNGKIIQISFTNLSNYFIVQRFCDKPTETSVSCFSVRWRDLTTEALDCIELMKNYSLIIEDIDGRKERNSGIKEWSFQMNKILAPLYSLPIIERGTMGLNKEVAEAIFNKSFHYRFDALYKKRKIELTAPFINKKNKKNDVSQINIFN